MQPQNNKCTVVALVHTMFEHSTKI